MRVTDRMTYDDAALYTGKARERLAEATDEVSSGLRVTHPGDDPGAAGLIVQQRAAEARHQAIGAAAGRAQDELDAADGALATIQDAIARARELATQLGSDSYDANARAGGATEMTGLVSTILGALNTKVGGRYLFGGNRDGSPPFDAAGNYLGDTGTRQVEISPGVFEAASVRADVALKGVGGGVDVLATLQSLAAALGANNGAAIRGALGGLETATAQVAAARGAAGTASSTFATAVAASRAAQDQATAVASHLADADVVEAATKLQYAKTALDAAMSASAQSFNMSLLHWLK